MTPSADRSRVGRGGGASLFSEPSSLSCTPEMTWTLAVAWAAAEAGREGGAAASTTAASNSIGMTRNAVGPEW